MVVYRFVHFLKSLFAAITLLLLLLSCANNKPETTIAETLFETLDESINEQPEVPSFINDALLNSASPQQNPYLNQRFDVAVKDVPAKEFFISLIKDTGVNVVAHPQVSGKISLQLNEVTVSEVLDVIRDVYGYEYRFENNIYIIYPKALRTEVFPINYIDVKRVGVSDTSVSIGEIVSSSGGKSGGGGGQSQSTTNSANILGMAGGEEGSGGGQGLSPGSRVQTLNQTDFWRMVEGTLKAIVDINETGRNVMINPQAGLVVVTAMPKELNAVRTFLQRSELIVKRQVVLEAKILEVQLNEGFEAGINWGAIQGQLQYSNNVVTTDGSGGIIESAPDTSEFFSSIFKIADISDLLSLLETQGAVQVLSSPRVSTVNNQKAVIRVGSDEFFVTGIANNTTASAGATTSSPEVELASFFSGISLDVTPQISEDGNVILHIHPIVSEVVDQQKEITVGDSKFSLPLALRDIRESDSVVRAKSGQVIVLGGLMQESSRDVVGKRPFLGYIPIIEGLFTRKSTGKKKTELVILLRPIVVGDDTWEKEINKYKSFSKAVGQEYRAR